MGVRQAGTKLPKYWLQIKKACFHSMPHVHWKPPGTLIYSVFTLGLRLMEWSPEEINGHTAEGERCWRVSHWPLNLAPDIHHSQLLAHTPTAVGPQAARGWSPGLRQGVPPAASAPCAKAGRSIRALLLLCLSSNYTPVSPMSQALASAPAGDSTHPPRLARSLPLSPGSDPCGSPYAADAVPTSPSSPVGYSGVSTQSNRSKQKRAQPRGIL